MSDSEGKTIYLVIVDDEVKYRTWNRTEAVGWSIGWEDATGDVCEFAEKQVEPPKRETVEGGE